MILRTLFLVCAVISPSLGKMDSVKFSLNFEKMCFQNDEKEPFRINGQDMPLSNSLENFIAMAERFEEANSFTDLKSELAFFISEYVFENLEITKGSINEWQIKRAHFQNIESMWNPEKFGYTGGATDPFIGDEKCSVYYMISHSLLNKDVALLESYSPRNFSSSSNRLYTDDLDPDHYFPQELGVVSIRGTDAAVSLSRVLLGLYVGLNQYRISDITSFDKVDLSQLTEDVMPTGKVDALYSVTLAEVLMQSKWKAIVRTGLAPNGKWTSIPFSTDKFISDFCPMVYKHEPTTGNLPAYSYSSVRGAADGLILGLSILPIYTKKPKVKLSQILRMYYSQDGISVESPIEDLGVTHLSFCDRETLIRKVENKLYDQLKAYGVLVADIAGDIPKIYTDAKNLYEAEKSNVFATSNTKIKDYCSKAHSIERPDELPRETFLDVIVVMDTSVSEKSLFQSQQLIVGHLAKQLDLRYTGSKMTILLDQRNETVVYGSSNTVELVPVVTDTNSSSCAACLVGQILHKQSSIERENVIVAIDQLLQERKENEKNKNGVNGKVVIYFNYESENGRSNNKLEGKLQKALKDLHTHHPDITFYAVGLDPELLKKYTTGDPNFIFLGTDGAEEVVAKNIYHKISFAPALLQYDDCEEARNEKGATYVNFISPLAVQHFKMPAEYFHKSFKLSFSFQSQNGNIKVCHNRATAKPENEEKFCNVTTSTTGVEFKFSNPCMSSSKESCAAIYFSIIGLNTNTDLRPDTRGKDYCEDDKDHWCSNLNQIKYTVSHTGVRCSGCLGLNAPRIMILLTALLSYFIYKRF